MRLILKLKTNSKVITLNYNYFLSAAIYKMLQFSSPQFAKFLHSKGYRLNGRMYKLFSFALGFEKISVADPIITLLSPAATLYVTSPMVDDFIRNFVIGTLQNRSIDVIEGIYRTSFEIEQIETVPMPAFGEVNYFKMISPLVISTRKETHGKFSQYFFRYNNDIEEINRVFNTNLKNKYELIYGKLYSGSDVRLEWDQQYILSRLETKKRLTKKISILKRGIQPVEIIANRVPFTLTGSEELIKVGYDCGFGEKNSMGFGLAKLAER
jgi:CRISPR-associated endoribonuclease Cas6